MKKCKILTTAIKNRKIYAYTNLEFILNAQCCLIAAKWFDQINKF